MTCLSSCDWSSCVYCSGQGECSPGEKGSTEACGNCGTRQQTCTSSCDWSWGTCIWQGECSPEESKSCNKVVNGTSCPGKQACTGSCAWGKCIPNDSACGSAQKVTKTFPVTSDCVVEYQQLDSKSTDDKNQEGQELKVGFVDESDSQYTWWFKYRTYLFFDGIESIPYGAAINKATLRLYVKKLKGQTGWNVQVKHALGSWEEGAITWDNQPGMSNSGVAEVSAPKATGWFEVDLTAQVQDIVDGAITYHGEALKSDKEGSAGDGIDAVFFFDDKPSTNAPKLDIEYTYTP